MKNSSTDNNNVTELLRSAPVSGLMLKLALPTVVAQVVNLLYNIVDRIYIGHMPENGSIALTGVGLCFPVIYLISAFTVLVAQGGAPRAAIYMGKGDLKSAQRLLGSCFSLLFIISVVLTTLFLLFGEKLLWLFGASNETIGFSLDYMYIYASGSIFVMMSLGLNMFITTQGFTKISMLTVVIGAVLNILLDPLFIFVFKLGVKGAAIATVISQAVSAVWALSFLCGKKTKLRLTLKTIKPDFVLLLPCLALGLAPFIMQSTEALVNIAFNSSLQKFGGDTAVGTFTVAATVLQIVWMPAQGIGQGAQPIISFNYGAKNAERCEKAFRCMLITSGAYLMFFYILVQSFPSLFMKMFTSDAALLQNTSLIRTYVGVMGFFFIQMSVQQGLVSIGKAKASLFIACLRKIILLVPLIYILPMFFEDKVFAVFFAEPLSDTISIITASIVFIFVFGGEMKKLKAEKA